MIKIGICDDEQRVQKGLMELLGQCLKELEEQGEIAVFSSGRELLKEGDGLDTLFLDTEMPEMDGIEIGRKLQRKNKDCRVIMASNRQERFKDAFKINAFWFTTKPFEKEEIKEALAEVFRIQAGSANIELYQERTKYTFYQKDILYLSSIDSSVEFFLKEGVFRKETSLKEMEHLLDKRLFYRVNKQCIVNMQHIDEYKNGMIEINGTEIGVSVRKKKEFEKRYLMFEVGGK